MQQALNSLSLLSLSVFSPRSAACLPSYIKPHLEHPHFVCFQLFLFFPCDSPLRGFRCTRFIVQSLSFPLEWVMPKVPSLCFF